VLLERGAQAVHGDQGSLDEQLAERALLGAAARERVVELGVVDGAGGVVMEQVAQPGAAARCLRPAHPAGLDEDRAAGRAFDGVVDHERAALGRRQIVDRGEQLDEASHGAHRA
jgi:hypothetical protein